MMPARWARQRGPATASKSDGDPKAEGSKRKASTNPVPASVPPIPRRLLDGGRRHSHVVSQGTTECWIELLQLAHREIPGVAMLRPAALPAPAAWLPDGLSWRWRPCVAETARRSDLQPHV